MTTVMWRVDSGLTRPTKTTAAIPDHPHRDDDGKEIFENTHFLEEGEAWSYLLRDAEAGESLALDFLTRSEKTLEEARLRLCEESKVGIATRIAFKKWCEARRR